MKVAVTAANGSLGTAVIRNLKLELGADNVIGIARTPEKAEHLGVEIRKGDYNLKSDFDLALKGVDALLIVSGMDHPDVRIIQHQNIINAAKEAGVKKLVYSSIIGKAGQSTFDPVINSNRQTEEDVQASGLDWAIGRNGLYIEPDVDFIEYYKADGKVANCGGSGLCSYVSRDELGYAYAKMLLSDDRNSKVFNLCGDAISQAQLTDYMNRAFDLNLVYEEMSPEAYLLFQQKSNGEFLGTIIAGIYTKIRNGEFHISSDYLLAAGKSHVKWEDYF